jgi:hypothetical protein
MSKSIEKYYVYSYEHIDNLCFIRSPAEVDQDPTSFASLSDSADAVAALFRKHGWEGDGDLGILWLPPFMPMGGETTAGFFVWHVKQDNNGTSYLASPHELPFTRLYLQNKNRPVHNGRIPEGLVRVSREGLKLDIDKILPELELDLAAVQQVSRSDQVSIHLLEHAQGRLVQALQSFLDDCYLRILIEVIRDGNGSGLKLRKSKSTLNPGLYLPDDSEGDVGGFFTLHGLISDMWRSYKFEPFKEKLEMLLKPLGIQLNGNLSFEIRKHVALRNSIQHHEGHIDRQLLEELGRQRVPILTPKGTGQLENGKPIVFTLEEVRAFSAHLGAFAEQLDEQVEIRVLGKVYASSPQHSD